MKADLMVRIMAEDADHAYANARRIMRDRFAKGVLMRFMIIKVSRPDKQDRTQAEVDEGVWSFTVHVTAEVD